MPALKPPNLHDLLWQAQITNPLSLSFSSECQDSQAGVCKSHRDTVPHPCQGLHCHPCPYPKCIISKSKESDKQDHLSNKLKTPAPKEGAAAYPKASDLQITGISSASPKCSMLTRGCPANSILGILFPETESSFLLPQSLELAQTPWVISVPSSS